MPGIAGFTAPLDASPTDCDAAIANMLGLMAHSDSDVIQPTGLDSGMCAGRVSSRIFQPRSQPIRIEGVRVWFDGELTNRDAVCASMDVTAQSDAELLGRLYMRLGDLSFLRRLDGIFAAVIQDRERQLLHLVTDRYGFRHLYWAIQNGRLYWSSEIKSFSAAPDFNLVIDERAIQNFFSKGYLLDDRTWITGVSVLSMASVLTWNVHEGKARQTQYWDFSRIMPTARAVDPREVIEEWHRLFANAVASRCRGGRVGVMLSGGLDSRAIVAALTDDAAPFQLATFGQDHSADVSIAKKVARVRGGEHHVQTATPEDWLDDRFAGVWWTDGQLNLIDMHGLHGLIDRRRWFDINVSGFIGDLTMGGSYFGASRDDEFRTIGSRCRRFNILGIKLAGVVMESRLPFVDKELFDFTYGIPRELRRGGALYKQMLLQRYPAYFRSIPWQTTGVPIGWPKGVARTKIRVDKLAERLRTAGFPVGRRRREFVDYATWLREDPARSTVDRLLRNPNAVARQWTSGNNAIDAWEKHLAGEDRTREVGLHVTLEVWMQQLLQVQHRPARLALSRAAITQPTALDVPLL